MRIVCAPNHDLQARPVQEAWLGADNGHIGQKFFAEEKPPEHQKIVDGDVFAETFKVRILTRK